MTLCPGKSCRKAGTKGQPEGSAINSRAGKPWVAKAGLVSAETTGQNNSSSTPYEASAANGEWELFLTSSSHYCFRYVMNNKNYYSINNLLLLEYVINPKFQSAVLKRGDSSLRPEKSLLNEESP